MKLRTTWISLLYKLPRSSNASLYFFIYGKRLSFRTHVACKRKANYIYNETDYIDSALKFRNSNGGIGQLVILQQIAL